MLYITPPGLLSNLKFVHYLYPFCPPSQLLAPGNHPSICSLYLWAVFFFFFKILHENNMQYLFLSLGLISLCIMPLRSNHTVIHGKISFFFNGWIIFFCMCLCMWVFHVFFIHSSISGGHWSCFHVLTIVNNAAVNMGAVFCFWVSDFVFFV